MLTNQHTIKFIFDKPHHKDFVMRHMGANHSTVDLFIHPFKNNLQFFHFIFHFSKKYHRNVTETRVSFFY